MRALLFFSIFIFSTSIFANSNCNDAVVRAMSGDLRLDKNGDIAPSDTFPVTHFKSNVKNGNGKITFMEVAGRGEITYLDGRVVSAIMPDGAKGNEFIFTKDCKLDQWRQKSEKYVVYDRTLCEKVAQLPENKKIEECTDLLKKVKNIVDQRNSELEKEGLGYVFQTDFQKNYGGIVSSCMWASARFDSSGKINPSELVFKNNFSSISSGARMNKHSRTMK